MLAEETRRRLWFYLNWECNLRCDYCAAESAPLSARPRLDFATFRALVDEAVALGFGEVALTGGEPLLHPQVMPMLTYAAQRADTVVLTNATLLTAAHHSALCDLPRERVTFQVSLDAARAEVHDRHRGAGSWQRAMRGLGLLLDWGCRVAVRATLSEGNAAELGDMRTLLTGMGVEGNLVYAAPLVRVGRAKSGLDPTAAHLGLEPTVAADGLYPHPLRVALSERLTDSVLPLATALGALADGSPLCRPGRSHPGYR